MGAVVEVFQQGLEELAQLLELVGVQQITGIEQHGLELGAMPGNPRLGHQRFGAVAVDLLGQFVGEGVDLAGQRAAAEQQCTVHRPQPTGFPAFQADRRRQAKGADHAVAEGRVGEVDIAV